MRFAGLNLLKYGHFDGCDLAFPAGEQDLQIIFGPNEAGKSTTMAAIADFLFGFGNITTFDFRHDQQLLRVGAVLQSQGEDFIWQRKKGRKGTLLDADDNVVDEARLTALLGGYGADTFQRMFSLDHHRLREGGRAILEAKDDVGQAIFAAGSGLVEVATILERLEAEAKEIWTRQAGSRRFHIAQRSYDEARARQKAAQVRPAAWDEVRKGIAALDILLADAREQRSLLETAREKIERQRRVMPHAALLRDLEGKLAPIADAVDLPPGAAAVFAEAKAALAGSDVERRVAQDGRTRVEQALQALRVDQRLVDRDAAIQALRESKGGVDKGSSDLPRLRTKLAGHGARIKVLQRELGWAEADMQAVIGRLPQRVRLAEVRGLLEDRSAIDALLTAAEEAEKTARARGEGLAQELALLPVAEDTGILSAAVTAARALGDIDQALENAEAEATRRSGALSHAMRQLTPWTADLDALRSLIAPEAGEVTDAATRQNEAEAGLVEAKRMQRETLDRSDALGLQRTQLMRDSGAVTLDALRAIREDRDAIWRRIDDHLRQASALPDPAETAGDFAGRVTSSDALADRRFDAATQSARLAAVDEEIERNALSLDQAARAIGEAEGALADAVATWTERLAPLGLTMGPKAFLLWLDRRERALAAATEHERATAAATQLRDRRDRVSASLAAALAELGKAPGTATTFVSTLDAAEQIERSEQAAASSRRDVMSKADDAREGLVEAEAKLETARARLAEWSASWSAAVEQASLDPAQSVAVIRAQIALLDELRSELDEVQGLDQRIAAIERDLLDFTNAVAAEATHCGIDTGKQSAEEVLTGLASAVTDNAAALTRRADLEKQYADAGDVIAEADASRARAVARLTPLSEVAGITEWDALNQAIVDSDAARGYRDALDRVRAEIIAAGGGPTLDALLAEIEDTESTALSARGTSLQEEIALLSDDIARLTGEHVAATAEFQRLDVGPDVAIAVADAEQARAEMADLAEAYLRKRAEIALLRWGIDRYRSSKQAPLLIRASTLFSRLTLGNYTSLLVDSDGGGARLAGLRANDDVVPVEGMSEGTVDQLFLSLRLAAVEDAVAAGARLPFLADDLFINYDDERAQAGFSVLAELARTTQILFFTHHHHLLGVAERAVSPLSLSTCRLE
ncbi:MAG: hypothetical protein JWR80_511 [Bradyrhizobium sp.]|nr:hypothetical protein [Bradyrhizobium sp.]